MKVPVLTYHAVLPVPRDADVRGTVPLAAFEEQIAWLARRGYRSVTLDQAADLLGGAGRRARRGGATTAGAQGAAAAAGGAGALDVSGPAREPADTAAAERATETGPVAGRPVVLTFDDGYRCVIEHALPVLERHGFTATLFVVPAVVGGTSDWYVRKGGVPFEHATWDELADARRRGFAVGSHSQSHRRLTEMAPYELHEELSISRQQIAERLGSCEHLAYPFGAVSTAVEDAAARCGYRTACTTEEGLNRRGQRLLALRRQSISRTTGRWRFRRRVGAPW